MPSGSLRGELTDHAAACGSALRVFDDWFLTPQRAAVHRPTATAVIADPHLGYDRARQRGGEAVPFVAAHSLLAALRTLAIEYGVQQLVIAGDLVENRAGLPAVSELLAGLEPLHINLAAVVPGNHDRGLTAKFPQFTVCHEGIEMGGWRVLHGDGRLPRARIVQGHIHPCVRLAGQTAPCFLVSERRIVLPAFSADAAGVNILRQAGWSRYRCYVVAGPRVLDFGRIADLKRKTASLRSSSAR
ncbi:MAG: metallophosphoesterase [Planctomycetia bacterium]|nr:metallophosphoesterase [Planctomycetia bacterium]